MKYSQRLYNTPAGLAEKGARALCRHARDSDRRAHARGPTQRPKSAASSKMLRRNRRRGDHRPCSHARPDPGLTGSPRPGQSRRAERSGRRRAPHRMRARTRIDQRRPAPLTRQLRCASGRRHMEPCRRADIGGFRFNARIRLILYVKFNSYYIDFTSLSAVTSTSCARRTSPSR